jgi:uncharacterized SAM-binding protein YcdF (DUF218 family)
VNSVAPEKINAARAALFYLSEVDPLPERTTDAVLGFGMFDVSLASFCGDLASRRFARRIVFTGGIGAGTADLGQPEADAWKEQLGRTHPAIPAGAIITENTSTNTAENIAFTARLLEEKHPDLSFGRGLKSVIVVASPSRLRRVKLTMQLMQPSVRVCRQLPPVSFDREYALYQGKGLNYLDHLRGELDRLVEYAQRGWIAPEPLPPEIQTARETLR